MRRIAHLADLHFGTERPEVAAALAADLRGVRPHVLAVSGDSTQRARRSQYRKAAAFFRSLPFPKVIVPGNHDIPLYDFPRRFLAPFRRFRHYLETRNYPAYRDDEIAVVGVNTAVPWLWKAGSLGAGRVEGLRDRLCAIPDSVFKVIVAHHPFIPKPGDKPEDIVRHAGLVIAQVEACGADLILAGHLHREFSGSAEAYYRPEGRSVLVVQAGTAISTRRRGLPNQYNLVTIDRGTLVIEPRVFAAGRFRGTDLAGYKTVDGAWEVWIPSMERPLEAD